MQEDERIGPYRVVRRIGRGGQASVYIAEHVDLCRQVALKVFDPGCTVDPSGLERFRREVSIASKLDHPGICPVFEAGEEGETLWIAMRYVDGESLAQKISRARQGDSTETTRIIDVSERRAGESAPVAESPHDSRAGPKTWTEITSVLALFEDIARALHAAHEAGVIHRDVKPANLMVGKDGAAVILDFGLARQVDGGLPTLTLHGDMMGTPAYMSPEQIASHQIRLDRRTDVYSLGVSLYESLTLTRPFDAPTREGLYHAILTKSPRDPDELNPSLPADLKIVLDTAIAKDRDRRYQTALDLAEDLRRVRLHEPIRARPVGALVRLRCWIQRNPTLATSVLGLFALLAAGLASALVLLSQRDRAFLQVIEEHKQRELTLHDYDRLGDLARLQSLSSEADTLWPCEPSMAPAMKAWLERGADLEQRLPSHREALARLDAAASRPSEVAADSRATRFRSGAEQFKHDTTEKLVVELAAFVDPDPTKGLLADVRRRLAFAESVDQATLVKCESSWADAIRSISNATECPKYAGLRIEEQLGLIPIGRDPDSGLWEFVHLQTTASGTDPVPGRGPDRRLLVTESTGIVFVLIHGGTFRMGAAKPDDDQAPGEPNVDPDALGNAAPVTSVTLDPFFVSKYEMTQGQWLRFVSRNPSAYPPGTEHGGRVADLRSPVEQVTWIESDRVLRRLGLTLPTEAQWEYAARAGTTTPRWTGTGTEGLASAANLADAFCREHGGPPMWKYESWSDGWTTPAPVGSFAPNPFGLHDVLGNVWEWCLDSGEYGLTPRPGDGRRVPSSPRTRVSRGGSWASSATEASSAVRGFGRPESINDCVGLRPGRALNR